VAEVNEALRAQDFDALAATAQKWLETHDGLQGIALHARKFPGWQNTAALRRHIRFVRDHQRNVRRFAVATNSKLADVAPRLARHLVQPDVMAFGYDELDRAISWAAGSDGERAAAAEADSGAPRAP
jgi:hypothetical protein